MSDTLSAVLSALGARASRRTVLEAGGDWALGFPALERLKFVAVLRGGCWLLPGRESPRQLSPGDVALIGRCDYAVASDPAVPRIDGLPFYEDGRDWLRLGGGDTMLIGGGVTFTAGTSDFLLDMLPPFLLVERASASASAVASILTLLDREAREPAAGSEAVVARLAELLVIEAIRYQLGRHDADRVGWLGALADPRLGRALQRFHADIARPWTVATLAAEAGMSRAAFAAAFRAMAGRSPNAYARAWRLTLARARLMAGAGVKAAAAEVGYTSQSAFGHAYLRAFGVSPGSDARKRGAGDPAAGIQRRRHPPSSTQGW
jgi:AraC-like DNA-binding protein